VRNIRPESIFQALGVFAEAKKARPTEKGRRTGTIRY